MRLKSLLLAGLGGVVLLASGFWIGRVGAETGDPGTTLDPLVSKSYVDQQLKALADQSGFQVVNLPKGSTFIGDGGTEVVLRAGEVVAVGSNLGGLLDVTGGTDLASGAPVTKNHLLVIPRSDGRGLRASYDSVLMVRGGYTLRSNQ